LANLLLLELLLRRGWTGLYPLAEGLLLELLLRRRPARLVPLAELLLPGFARRGGCPPFGRTRQSRRCGMAARLGGMEGLRRVLADLRGGGRVGAHRGGGHLAHHLGRRRGPADIADDHAGAGGAVLAVQHPRLAGVALHEQRCLRMLARRALDKGGLLGGARAAAGVEQPDPVAFGQQAELPGERAVRRRSRHRPPAALAPRLVGGGNKVGGALAPEPGLVGGRPAAQRLAWRQAPLDDGERLGCD